MTSNTRPITVLLGVWAGSWAIYKLFAYILDLLLLFLSSPFITLDPRFTYIASIPILAHFVLLVSLAAVWQGVSSKTIIWFSVFELTSKALIYLSSLQFYQGLVEGQDAQAPSFSAARIEILYAVSGYALAFLFIQAWRKYQKKHVVEISSNDPNPVSREPRRVISLAITKTWSTAKKLFPTICGITGAAVIVSWIESIFRAVLIASELQDNLYSFEGKVLLLSSYGIAIIITWLAGRALIKNGFHTSLRHIVGAFFLLSLTSLITLFSDLVDYWALSDMLPLLKFDVYPFGMMLSTQLILAIAFWQGAQAKKG